MSVPPNYSRVTLLAHTIFKNGKKVVYRVLFLTRDYNTKSQKSKKLPAESKNCKVPHKHDAWNCKNGLAWASAAIITNKQWVSGNTSRHISGASIRERRLCPPYIGTDYITRMLASALLHAHARARALAGPANRSMQPSCRLSEVNRERLHRMCTAVLIGIATREGMHTVV